MVPALEATGAVPAFTGPRPQGIKVMGYGILLSNTAAQNDADTMAFVPFRTLPRHPGKEARRAVGHAFFHALAELPVAAGAAP